MPSKKSLVFKALYIVAWIIFVGLSIEACGLLVNFIISVVKPEWIGNLYQKMDLTSMYQRSQWAFYSTYSLMLFISITKACLFYIVINLLHKLDLSKPFNPYVSKQILRISHWTLGIGLCCHIARHFVHNLEHRGYVIDQVEGFLEGGATFIIMAAIIYIIAAIFAKGVELQNENDLTV